MKFLFLVLALLASFLFAKTEDEFRGEAKAKIENLQKENSELKAKIEKMKDDVQNDTKDLIDRQDKRIEDINFNFNAATAWIFGLFTIIGIVMPFIQWRVNSRLIKEAEAIEVDTRNKLEDLISKYEKKLIELEGPRIDYLSIQDKISSTSLQNNETQNIDNKSILEGALKYALYKAETHNSYSDNFEVANIYFQLGNYQKSLEYWNKLLKFNIIDIQEAILLYNKGVTLAELNKSEAIKVYDELMQKFKDSQNEAIKEQVAKAMCNKGVSLGVLNKSEEAKECFLQAIEKKPDYLLAYINLFEINLILNEDFDSALVGQFQNYAKNNRQAQLKFNMLQTIQKAKNGNQTEQIIKLKQEFSDVNFGSWGWNELDAWANKLENQEKKQRVTQTIEAFKNWDSI